MDTPREKAIVEAIKKYIRSLPRGWAEKTHGGPYSAGQPDVDAVIAGRAVKLEVKRPGKDATALQRRKLETWARAGAVTGVVTSVDETRRLLEECGILRSTKTGLEMAQELRRQRIDPGGD